MEDSNLTLLMIMMSIFALSLFIYMMLMVFYPEWVGITGKDTKEAERKRQMGIQVQDGEDLITKWSQADEKTDSKLKE